MIDGKPSGSATVVEDDAGRSGPAVCEACGAPLEPGDEFCPECGVELPAGRGLRHRRQLRLSAVAVVLVTALAAAASFAVLWQSEASSADRARSRLDAAAGQTAAAQATEKRLQREVAAARLRLAQAERLTAGRGDVLARTNQVVMQVDPLLSSVDALQKLTAQIQTSRNNFADGATEVVDLLIAFSNEVLSAQENGDEVDPLWVDDQVDAINDGLEAMGASYDALDSSDAAYSKASLRFEARANEFDLVIRKLQQQLQTVVAG